LIDALHWYAAACQGRDSARPRFGQALGKNRLACILGLSRVAVNQPSAADRHSPPRSPLVRLRWVLWGAVLLVGVGAGAALFALRPSAQPAAVANGPVGPTGPDVSWAAGARRAPGFALTDQAGKPVSLAAYRGRPVIVTFIDPLCRNLCPLEAKVLNDVVHQLPAASRPAILAVSTNVYGNARVNLLQDVRKWKLVPQWRWAVGGGAQLAPVWKDYQVQVLVTTKTIAGVTVHEIAHTEVAFVVDSAGYQRALYLYPFRAQDVERTLRSLG
jgi:cytochrome oxidase Cu insertion factor (SCO1/SenC/PrrC family)